MATVRFWILIYSSRREIVFFLQQRNRRLMRQTGVKFLEKRKEAKE
jgi:hypothetical protein